jgi:ABC-type spermidine/putrescine transport system permease subunit II
MDSKQFDRNFELMRIFLICFFVFILLSIPFTAFMSGRAKAKYLKETKGIEMAWYEAAFLDVRMTSAEVDADLSIKNR